MWPNNLVVCTVPIFNICGHLYVHWCFAIDVNLPYVRDECKFFWYVHVYIHVHVTHVFVCEFYGRHAQLECVVQSSVDQFRKQRSKSCSDMAYQHIPPEYDMKRKSPEEHFRFHHRRIDRFTFGPIDFVSCTKHTPFSCKLKYQLQSIEFYVNVFIMVSRHNYREYLLIIFN